MFALRNLPEEGDRFKVTVDKPRADPVVYFAVDEWERDIVLSHIKALGHSATVTDLIEESVDA